MIIFKSLIKLIAIYAVLVIAKYSYAESIIEVQGHRISRDDANIAKSHDKYVWELLKDKGFMRAWATIGDSNEVPAWVHALNVTSSKKSNMFCLTNNGEAIIFSGAKVHDGHNYIDLAYFPGSNLVLLSVATEDATEKTFSSNKKFKPVHSLVNTICKEK